MSLLIYGGIALLVLLVVILLASYVKSPPSNAFIISGITKLPKVLIGTGGIRIPFLQRLDKVYLGQVTVDVKTSSPVPTSDMIKVNVDSVVKIRVLPTTDGVQLAAKNFLNMSPEEISNQVQDSLQGNMREIIGTLTLVALNSDRDAFSDKIAEKATNDMNKLGLEIISCNIQEINDTENLIVALGTENSMKIKSEASKVRAIKEAEIAIVESEEAKKANDARVASEMDIATKNNDLQLKKLDLEKIENERKAQTDAALQIEVFNQKKEINIREVNAEISKTEREEELTQKRIVLEQNRLTADVNKKAEADKFKVKTEAEAELERLKRKAEAETYTAIKEAEAMKAKADAEKVSMELEAEGKKKMAEADAFELEAKGLAEAAAIKAKGEAEAEAIKAKGLAEAEAMEKKAEAYEKYGQAAMTEMVIGVLPEVAKSIADPISSIKNMNIYGSDAEGMSQVSGQVPVIMKKVMDTLSNVTGVDMSKVVASNTIDAKTNKNISLEGGVDITKEIITE